MNLNAVQFPLYKLRAYLNIETNPLGLVKITTVKGIYIFDDTSIPGTFEERRAKLPAMFPDKPIYKLKERVLYLRQLVKYRSGTTFVDSNGYILKYTKSSKLFTIESRKITRKRAYGNWTILSIEGEEQSYLVGQVVLPTTTHVSLMRTKWGPLLYDLTSEAHESYKRKI